MSEPQEGGKKGVQLQIELRSSFQGHVDPIETDNYALLKNARMKNKREKDGSMTIDVGFSEADTELEKVTFNPPRLNLATNDSSVAKWNVSDPENWPGFWQGIERNCIPLNFSCRVHTDKPLLNLASRITATRTDANGKPVIATYTIRWHLQHEDIANIRGGSVLANYRVLNPDSKGATLYVRKKVESLSPSNPDSKSLSRFFLDEPSIVENQKDISLIEEAQLKRDPENTSMPSYGVLAQTPEATFNPPRGLMSSSLYEMRPRVGTQGYVSVCTTHAYNSHGFIGRGRLYWLDITENIGMATADYSAPIDAIYQDSASTMLNRKSIHTDQLDFVDGSHANFQPDRLGEVKDLWWTKLSWKEDDTKFRNITQMLRGIITIKNPHLHEVFTQTTSPFEISGSPLQIFEKEEASRQEFELRRNFPKEVGAASGYDVEPSQVAYGGGHDYILSRIDYVPNTFSFGKLLFLVSTMTDIPPPGERKLLIACGKRLLAMAPDDSEIKYGLYRLSLQMVDGDEYALCKKYAQELMSSDEYGKLDTATEFYASSYKRFKRQKDGETAIARWNQDLKNSQPGSYFEKRFTQRRDYLLSQMADEALPVAIVSKRYTHAPYKPRF